MFLDLGSSTFVPMVKTANLGKRNDFSSVARLHWLRFRRVLLQS
jgi:hypothetical protein